jgi:hypothetical protein
MTRPFARRSILLACCVTACSLAAIRCDNPAGPDSERDGQPPHVVKELRIEGNLHLAGPNDTSQLRALAVMADGTVLDVTRFVVWRDACASAVTCRWLACSSR